VNNKKQHSFKKIRPSITHQDQRGARRPSPIKTITEASITHQDLDLRPITHHQTIMIDMGGGLLDLAAAVCIATENCIIKYYSTGGTS
jgi:hypothetical protein